MLKAKVHAESYGLVVDVSPVKLKEKSKREGFVTIVGESETGLARMVTDLRRWSCAHLHYVADLILPPVCLHCHEPVSDHGVLCASCWGDIAFITPPFCDRLGTPLDFCGEDIAISTAALRDPPPYDRTRAVARFGGVMRNLIHGFKYSDRHEASDMLARWMRKAGADVLNDADALIPVPLHPTKLWRRRYNQAAILAQKLSVLTGKPADIFSLRRIRATESQVGLSQDDRIGNVAAAFAVAPGYETKISGKRIVLIDDVITTGSTLNACTLALMKAKAKSVDCLALALAIGGTDSWRETP